MSLVYDGTELLQEAEPLDTLSPASTCSLAYGMLEEVELTLQEAHEVLCANPMLSKPGYLILGTKAYVRLQPLDSVSLGLCGVVDEYFERDDLTRLNFFYDSMKCMPFAYRSTTVLAELSTNPSPFNLVMLLNGHNDDYNPPHEAEISLALTFQHAPCEQDVVGIVGAYLYQLAIRGFLFKVECPTPPAAETLSIAFPERQMAPLDLSDRYTEASIQPLLTYHSKGISRLASEDYETAFLSFYKVLEHASGVVVARDIKDWVAEGVYTARSLKKLRFSDDAAVARLLSDLLLPKSIGETARQMVRKSSASLVEVLSSTRNFYSHAKAGYPLSGTEIMEPALPQGCLLIRKIADYVIEWYSDLPDTDKLAA